MGLFIHLLYICMYMVRGHLGILGVWKVKLTARRARSRQLLCYCMFKRLAVWTIFNMSSEVDLKLVFGVKLGPQWLPKLLCQGCVTSWVTFQPKIFVMIQLQQMPHDTLNRQCITFTFQSKQTPSFFIKFPDPVFLWDL